MFKCLNESDLLAVERVICSRDSCLLYCLKCGWEPQEAALISIWISYQNSHTLLLFLRLLVSDDALF